MEPIFRALADPSRRLLLDLLFERDGRTLTDLRGHLPGMTRFGVMRHLDVLEAADLITTRRVGREKLHYLNPVPIRLIHDRWISKYAEPVVGSMTALKRHLEEPALTAPAHVYSIHIRTTPDALWRAITDGEQTARYYYGTAFRPTDGELRAGVRYTYDYPDGSPAADGEILEVDPPRRLALTFHALWDPEIAAEAPLRQVWEIEPGDDGTCRLSVTTEGLIAGTKSAEEFEGGIVLIVSGLKTMLETGESLAVAAG
jgi:uncharacterized protein YndB with AHSA1/START domain/DNA-binding transcriptional ArsR family regulator